MHDDSALVEARIARFVRERLTPAVYRERTPLDVAAWVVPGEPVSFDEAVAARFAPMEQGTAWGRPWGTVWFHLTGSVPPGWDRAEVLVDLGFSDAQPGFQAEGLVHGADGTVLSGIEPYRRHVAVPGPSVDLYVEAAANPDLSGGWRFAPTPLGDPATAGDAPLYRLGAVELANLDVRVWELAQDVWTLRGLLGELPRDTPRWAQVLRALELVVDLVDPSDVAACAAEARAVLAPTLDSPAHASAHRVHAVGHAHLDSAWLWPVRETVRKVGRTVANVLSLMDADDGFAFAMSSAQQFAWLAEHQPALFARLRERVRQGRFTPVGGMWVESDTNLPGGEALARQFVVGGRWFRENVGVECDEVWLPDSFGYSGNLPQIMTAAGARWFLTQKLSWNETNTIPHHTFDWEGIDGTRIFTHFPPVDTYGAELSGAELARASRRFAEKGRANTSLVPFGWSDGGGGPTREMLAAAARTADLEGSPKVALSTPSAFHEAARAEYARPAVWSGELYLEFHRGTYTSQAATKRGNRRCEHLLREAELWAATATVRTGAPYPSDVLDRCWRTVLLQQFHDILPGTSIAWVHQEAERRYAEVAAALEEVIARSLITLTGPGDRPITANAGPYPRAGVLALSAARVQDLDTASSVSRHGGSTTLDDGRVRAVVDQRGLLVSVVVAGRELIPPGSAANLLQLHRDAPTRWDAWDVDEHHRRTVRDLAEVESLTVDGAAVRIVRTFGASTVTQTITLHDGSVDIVTDVDWHERQKLLKLAFPLDVHADRAASEIQFGHVYRPTHTNTSWDAARFETCAHRWVHVGEPGFGVAVANDATYGHDIGRTTRADGGTTTTVRLSLVRAPLFPDPSADQGSHRFVVSLRPDATIADAVAEGYRLNLPLRTVQGARDVEPLISVDDPAVVVEAVKLAEDGSRDVVVRLYEALGSRAVAKVTANFPHRDVTETDLHERAVPASAYVGGTVTLRPFRIVTLRFVI